MNDEILKKIEKQNEVIISLLGRMAFPPDRIKEIVVKKKKNPEKYIEGYNSCDGNRNVNDLAAIVGVDQSTLSPILQEWAEMGILGQIERPKGKFYKRLYLI